MSTQKQWKDHPRWQRISVYVTGGLLAAVCALIAVAPDQPAQSAQPKQELTADQKREKILREQFSSWDGAHMATERAIKASLNDPDSYKHYETKYWLRNDGSIKVLTQIGARNGFGGMVRVTFESMVSPSGEVMSLTNLD